MPGESAPSLGSRFRLVERVGAGSFGEVHRALDGETRRPVAVKRLHPHLCEPQSIGRLWREAELLSQIDSPYVVRYVAHGFDEEARPCLVLEWLDGADLAKLCRSRKLSVEEAAEIVRQAALGLGALHQAGIIHRDVKPGNFFVTTEAGGSFQVRLLDLGVARREDPLDATVEGEIIGTPSYMSPEQARGERVIGPSADLYGLGVVLYQLLSGRRPFTGADPFAILAKIILEEPPALRTLVPHLSPALDQIVARALQKDKGLRFGSALDMARALEQAPVSGDEAPPGLDEVPTAPVRPVVLSATREQRMVSALFAHFALPRAGESLEPIERAIDLFTTLVDEQKGAAYRTLGDRMIAVFGAAHARGDEASRAARTALSLVARIGTARLAITTGRALPSASGLGGPSLERGAAEVERAGAGTIVIDPGTARALGPSFLVESKPSGLSLVGERDAAVGLGPRLLGKETPTLGRDDELSRLGAIVDECVETSCARVVLVTAEAGVGKSRLRYELIRRQTTRRPEIEILLGRGDPLRAGSPFGLLSDAIRRSAGIVDGEERKSAQRKLRARVGAHMTGRAHARATLFLGEICGVPFPDATSQALRSARRDPMLMGDGMRRAFEDWLSAETAAAPVMLVLEDLHLGDVATIGFVDTVLRNLRASPLLVLALARPEVHDEFPSLWRQRALRELRLDPLRDEACRAIVLAALPEATPLQVDFVVGRARGNPFYLEELVRALATGADGALPETALGMVQARLDALGARAKLVLRAASVFGTTFWRDGVLALLGSEAMGAEALDACLGHLGELEVVVRRATPRRRDDEYAFQSALIRDAAYATLVDDDLQRAHRLAAHWLEAVDERDASLLAEHCARGGEPQRAVGYCLRGALQALEGNDLSEAIERAQRGVDWGAEGETLGLLKLLMAEAYRWRGGFAEAAERGEEAIARLPLGSAAWFRGVAEVITASGRLGRYDAAARWVQEAERAEPVADPARRSLEGGTRAEGGFDSVFPTHEPDGGDPREEAPDAEARRAKIICLARGVLQLHYASRTELAAETLRLAESLAGPLASLEPVARARIHQARAIAALFAGEPARYVTEHESALAAFEAAADERSACQELVSLGSGYSDLGQYEPARSSLEKAIASAYRLGLAHVGPWARQNLAKVLLLHGELDGAEEMARIALDAGESGGDQRLAGGAHIYLARAALARGDSGRAISEATLAEDLLAGAPALRAAATATLSRSLRASGDLDASLHAAARATACLQALGEGKMGESESAVRLALVEVLEERGDASARDALAVAHRRLIDRAGRIEDEALRESYLRNIPDHARTIALARRAEADPRWPC